MNLPSPLPVLFPPETVNERYYMMVSRRVNSWFTPGIYYSAYYVNVLDRVGREMYQHDSGCDHALRHQRTLVAEARVASHAGTAALDNRALNDGRDPEELAPFWGAFFVKTTAYF